MILTPSKKEEKMSSYKYMGLFEKPPKRDTGYDIRDQEDYSDIVEIQKEYRVKNK